MPYNDLIDSFAAFRKLGIEMSDQPPDDKKLAELRVDCLSSLAKLFAPTPNQRSIMQEVNFEWVRQVKAAAQKYSVDKVVLFPYPSHNQRINPLLHAYGGEIEKLFEEIGFPSLSGNKITAEERSSLICWEREYGIVLYERDLDK